MGELLRGPFCSNPKQSPSRSAGFQESHRLWRLIWSHCPAVGWRRLEQLEQLFGDLEQAWQASTPELEHALGGTRINIQDLERIEAYRQQVGPVPLSHPPTTQQRLQWSSRRCLLPSDTAFPRSLATAEQPPLALYWKGRGSLWAPLRQRQAVAVIGSRRPSRHGLTMADTIGRALAEGGWPVLGGLDEGIQAAAHQGCLSAGGRPVAVLGTPLEQSSPRALEPLQQQIASEGLVISEWPQGTKARSGHFALRKRLELGLVEAVVLVECPLESKALKTAHLAWQQGLPIWVVPADAGRSSAAGSNRLLGQGAAPLLVPAEFLKQLGQGPLAKARHRAMAPKSADLQGREAVLLAALGQGTSLEQLCRSLRQSPSGISQRLLKLELAGLVRSAPGLWWHPC